MGFQNILVGKESLADLHSRLFPIAHHWENFGTHLGLYTYTIESIKRDYRSDPECLRKVLENWLDINYSVADHGLPSWRKACEEVANPAAGNNMGLAIDIARLHPQLQEHSTAGQEESPGQLPCACMSMPWWAEP